MMTLEMVRTWSNVNTVMIKGDVTRLRSLLLDNLAKTIAQDANDTLADGNLLTIFRIATISRFVMAVILYIVLLREIDEQNTGRFLFMLDALLLSIYLSTPLFRRLLRQHYMIVALVWASIVPLIITSYTIHLFFTMPVPVLFQNRLEQIENFVVLSNIAQTLPILLIPLLIVSWRFTRRAVIQFCLTTSLLDIILIVFFVQLNDANLAVALSLITFRLIILMLVGLMVNYLVALQSAQTRALQDANAQLRDYAATREYLITSRERNRLAREMHDTLAHTLAAATVQLEAVQVIWSSQPERAQELVKESAATMRSGLQDTRRALQALRAETIESVGLVESIQVLAASVQDRFGVNVVIDASAELLWLTQEQEHILYRVTQEALLNSAQHAAARNITIKLTEYKHALYLSVRDDGIGFDPATINTGAHFGVQGMRERADIIGAQFSVTSRIGQGTRIQLSLEREPNGHSSL
jgi:signal transduction histidine kinase